ncbi:MAG TPA: hypothetical protein VD973_14445 [Symbiobacteriaceae bacterium]|nr:hypothetical protein [Symbiobacteriaceae bacterium]
MQQQIGSVANTPGADWPQDQQGTASQALAFGPAQPFGPSPAPSYAQLLGQPQAPSYAQILGQPQAPSYAPPYGQPPAQPYAQPFGQPAGQPYAQPQPQTYVQPYTLPEAQPFGQQQAFPLAQPQPQPYAPPQAQAPPVPPVSAPVAPGAAGGANAQQPTPQQQFARHLTGIARTLEQALPSYQLTISVLLDVSVSAKADSVAGVPALLEQLQQAAFTHYAALGAIRRFLVGEATPDVLASLAVGVNKLISLHSKTRSQWEQTLASAPADVRTALSPLNQVITGAESLLKQAATGVQQAVGPQIWAAAQARAAEAAAE